jgi:transposase
VNGESKPQPRTNDQEPTPKKEQENGSYTIYNLIWHYTSAEKRLALDMARTLPIIGQENLKAVQAAWEQKQPDWARQRLLVIRLGAQHELTAEQIGEAAGISRRTVFRYLDTFMRKGVEGLLKRRYKGKKPTLKGSQKSAFVRRLEKGEFRRAKEAQSWLEQRTGKTLALVSIYKLLGKLGGVLKVPRKTHIRKDPAKSEAFKKELCAKLTVHSQASPGQTIRVWVLDEHRYGLLPVIRRCWGKRGVRVHAPYLTKYKWGYLHEAMEVDAENKLELLFTPVIDQETHLLFLKQIAESQPEALHVIIADQAGFHVKPDDKRLPANVRLEPLPPYSPELNPVEKLGDLVKDAICNRVYPTLRKLEDAIYGELKPLCEQASRVAQLIGEGWLLDQVNSGDPP